MPIKSKNQMRDMSGVPDIPKEFLDQLVTGGQRVTTCVTSDDRLWLFIAT